VVACRNSCFVIIKVWKLRDDQTRPKRFRMGAGFETPKADNPPSVEREEEGATDLN